MRRSVLSSAVCVLLALGAQSVRSQEPELRREGGYWVQTVTVNETVPMSARLRVNTHGPVKVSTDPSGGLTTLAYSVRLSVKAHNENDARRMLRGYTVRVAQQGGWVVVTAPRGPANAAMTLQVPRGLREVALSTSDGPVEVTSVDAPLRVDSGAGMLKVDHAGGDCKLVTGGGEIRAGAIDGMLTAVTGGGHIVAKTVKGEAVLETAGGDITIDDVGGPLRAHTMGGTVRVGSAGANVAASTGGGSIIVGRAQGLVTARNAAGPVQVGAASGVRCEAGTGAIRLTNISGAMRVSTAMGSIIASLLAGKLTESFLSTGNGDITVVIPSNLGVTVRAENEMADTLQRIVSEFPGVPVRLQGTQVVAEGAINGGGPLLRISGTGGTIFIKRQP